MLELFADDEPKKMKFSLNSNFDPSMEDGWQGERKRLDYSGTKVTIEIKQSSRLIESDFDLEGRLTRVLIKGVMGDMVLCNEVMLLERNFNGDFTTYPVNIENLTPGRKNINVVKDYYNRVVESDIETSKLIVDSLINQISLDSLSDFDLWTTRNSANRLRGKTVDDFLHVLENIKKYNWDGLQKNEIFNRTYPTSVTVLPPDVRPDRNPLFAVIQLTNGCKLYSSPKSRCNFCASYNGVDYHEKSLDELNKHIEDVARFTGDGWQYVRKIFLADADPLRTKISTSKYLKFIKENIPQKLEENVQFLPQTLPDIQRYESFVSTGTILSKSEQEWAELYDLGLKTLYWAVESADPETLKFLGKPHTKDMLYRAAERLNKTGIPYGIMVLSGIGGIHPDMRDIPVEENSHVTETVKFAYDISCKLAYVSNLRLLPGSNLFDMVNDRDIAQPIEEKMLQEHDHLSRRLSLNETSMPWVLTAVRGKYASQFVPSLTK